MSEPTKAAHDATEEDIEGNAVQSIHQKLEEMKSGDLIVGFVFAGIFLCLLLVPFIMQEWKNAKIRDL
jgi:hypothetical protein